MARQLTLLRQSLIEANTVCGKCKHILRFGDLYYCRLLQGFLARPSENHGCGLREESLENGKT